MSEPATPPPHPTRREAEAIVARAVDEGRLERAPAERLAAGLARSRACTRRSSPAPPRASAAPRATSSASRATSSSRSPTCAATAARYCTFAKQPGDPAAKTYTLAEVESAVARRAARGLHRGAVLPRRQAGDRLPQPPRVARRARLSTTAEYLVQACELAFAAGILPHSNAGILSAGEMEKLRKSNASLGLMLESTSPRLREKGEAHYYCPDKDPAVRLRMHARGRRAADPVHERDPARDRRERRRARRHAARDPRPRRPLRPHPGSDRAAVPPQARHADARRRADLATRWSPAGRRSRACCSGPSMNVQAPPNLAPNLLELLLARGRERLGRRLAAHDRLHQPRGAVAGAARAAPPHRGGRPAARRAAARLSRAPARAPRVLRAARARGRARARRRRAGWRTRAGAAEQA